MKSQTDPIRSFEIGRDVTRLYRAFLRIGVSEISFEAAMGFYEFYFIFFFFHEFYLNRRTRSMMLLYTSGRVHRRAIHIACDVICMRKGMREQTQQTNGSRRTFNVVFYQF